MSEKDPPGVPDIDETDPELPRIEIDQDTLDEPIDRSILKEIERARDLDDPDGSDE